MNQKDKIENHKEKALTKITNNHPINDNNYNGRRGKPKNSKSSTVMLGDNVHHRILRESRSVSWNVPVYVSKKEKNYNQQQQQQVKGKKPRKLSSYSEPSAYGDTRLQKQDTVEDHEDLAVDYQQPAQKKVVSLRARYWSYLFENLKHAIDEIYVTCEEDESVVECKEVLMVLDTYQHDFQALIDWINLQEKLKKSNEHNRPTSLAWEVRKSSPGRPRQKLTPRSQKNQSTPKRENREIKPKALTPTWADRVRGLPTEVKTEQPVKHDEIPKEFKVVPHVNGVLSDHETSMNDEDDGWQTVARTRQTKSSQNVDINQNKIRGGYNKTNQRSGAKYNKQNSSGHSPRSNTKLVMVASNSTTPAQNSPDQSVKLITNVSSVKQNNLHTPENNCEAPFYNYVADRITETQNMMHSTTASSNEHLQQSLFTDEDDEQDKLNNLEDMEKEFFNTEQNGQDFEIECELTASGNLKETTVTSARLREADASIAAYEQEEKNLMQEIEAEKKKTFEDEANDMQNDASVSLSEKQCNNSQSNSSWEDIMAQFQVDQASGQSWADLVDMDEELREPGRVVQMHEKLSSPSRRTTRESRQDLDQKLQLASLRREKMLQDKAENIHILTEKVDQVRALKNNLLAQRKELVREGHIIKLQRAQEQREMKLLNIVRKATVENTKVNEIAFINELQEQNKRQEVQSRIMEHEARMEELVQERNKLQEVKAAKEENAKERRKALEKERQHWIDDLVTKRREHEARIEQVRLEKEKEREKVAKERAREREERLNALSAAHQVAVTELQKKIQMKHNESERRHQEQIVQRKEKALELSMGKFTLTPTTIPSQTISTMTPSTGNKTQGVPAISMKDLDTIETTSSTLDGTNNSPRLDDSNVKGKELLQEKKKSMKKRAKKVRTRMVQRATEFAKLYKFDKQRNEKSKIPRLIKNIVRTVSSLRTNIGSWPAKDISTLDRSLGEINRILEKKVSHEKNVFREHGGFECLESVLSCASMNTSQDAALPEKSIIHTANLLGWSCFDCFENCVYVLFSNHICTVIDVLATQLMNNLSNKRLSPTKQTQKHTHDDVFSPGATALMHAMSGFLGILSKWPAKNVDVKTALRSAPELLRVVTKGFEGKTDSEINKGFMTAFWNRGLDIISYIVSSAILDALSQYLGSVQSEVGTNGTVFIRYSLSFLSYMINLVAVKNTLSAATKESNLKQNDPWGSDHTQLSATLYNTEIVGVISVLYGVLLQGAPERPTTLTNRRSSLLSSDYHGKEIVPHALGIAMSVFRVLNLIAYFNIHLLQSCLGADGVSLEYRHICTYLLWYCKQGDHAELLHDVITSIGHFTLAHTNNQDLVNSGAMPTVLQQLCVLPFSYFSNPKLTRLLFPTLIACCHQHEANLQVLQEEASPSLLSNFIETSMVTAENDENSEENEKEDGNTRQDVVSSKLYTKEYLQSSLLFFNEHQAK